jgi:hypothetical protein
MEKSILQLTREAFSQCHCPTSNIHLDFDFAVLGSSFTIPAKAKFYNSNVPQFEVAFEVEAS